MKTLPIRSLKYPNLVALIDDEDFEKLSLLPWYVHKSGQNFYALTSEYRNGKTRHTVLHSTILGVSEPGKFVDHIDRNSLNNQKSNLRWVTPQQNALNIKKYALGKRGANVSSKYKGVSKDRDGYWKMNFHFGSFHFSKYLQTELASALAYDEFAIVYHKEFASLNFDRAGRTEKDIDLSKYFLKRPTSSKYPNVHYSSKPARRSKWIAIIRVGGRQYEKAAKTEELAYQEVLKLKAKHAPNRA